MARRLGLVLARLWLLAMVAGCELDRSPELLRVDGFGPDRLEAGDRVTIRGEGFARGKPARVRLLGRAYRAGEGSHAVDHEVEGHASSGKSVELVVDEALEAALSGPSRAAWRGEEAADTARRRHATFRGTVSVAFVPQNAGAPPVRGSLGDVVLDVFPSGRTAEDSVQAREQGARTLAFLGISRVSSSRYGLVVEDLVAEGRALSGGMRVTDTITSFANVRVLTEADLAAPPGERHAELVLLNASGETRPLRFDLDGLEPRAPDALRYMGLVLGSLATLCLVWFLGGRRFTTWVEWRRARDTLALRKSASGVAARHAERPRYRLRPVLLLPVIGLSFGVGIVVRPALGRVTFSAGADLSCAFTLISLAYAVAVLVAGGRRDRGWSFSRGAAALMRWLSTQLPAVAALGTLLLSTGSIDPMALSSDQGALPPGWRFVASPASCIAFVLWTFGAFPRPDGAERTLDPARGGSSRAGDMAVLGVLSTLHSHLMCAIGVVAFLGGWRVPGQDPHTLSHTALLLFAAKIALLSMLLECLRRWVALATPRYLLPVVLRFALPLAIGLAISSFPMHQFRLHPLTAWLVTSVPPLLVVVPFVLFGVLVAWRRRNPDRDGHAINPWL